MALHQALQDLGQLQAQAPPQPSLLVKQVAQLGLALDLLLLPSQRHLLPAVWEALALAGPQPHPQEVVSVLEALLAQHQAVADSALEVHRVQQHLEVSVSVGHLQERQVVDSVLGEQPLLLQQQQQHLPLQGGLVSVAQPHLQVPLHSH